MELISVIIPVYNGEKFIREAIESILQQSVRPLEIIVIDDGSTDATGEVVKSYEDQIRYVYQERSGIAAARNRGLEMVQGNLITFIDADDIWLQNKLEIQLKILFEKPEYEMVIGLLTQIPISETKKVLEQEEKEGKYFISLGSTLIKTSVFDKIGHFDTEMVLGEDVDIFYRILESGIKVKAHLDIVQLHRRHDKNITNDLKETNRYLIKAIKKSLDRRRRAGNKIAVSLPSVVNMSEIINYWHKQ